MPSIETDVAGRIELGLVDCVRARETREEVGKHGLAKPGVDVVDALVGEGGSHDDMGFAWGPNCGDRTSVINELEDSVTDGPGEEVVKANDRRAPARGGTPVGRAWVLRQGVAPEGQGPGNVIVPAVGGPTAGSNETLDRATGRLGLGGETRE